MRAGGASLRYRFAADLRKRAGAWLVVGAIIGLSAGVVLALVAGARRTDTAVERFVAGADAHEDLIISGIPGTFDFAEVDLEEVAALPGVVDSVPIGVLTGAGRTDSGVTLDSGSVNFLVDPSNRMGSEVSRFKYRDGGPADPDDPRQIVAAFRTAENLGLEVGDTLEINFLDSEELSSVFTPAEEGGTTFEELGAVEDVERLEVVGIAVGPGELAPPRGDDTSSFWLTPAAAETFGYSRFVETVAVQLEDGPAGERAFLDRVEALGDERPVLSISVPDDAREADKGVTPIVRALHLAAALLGVVTLLVAGQVLARQAATESVDDPTLRALGWTPRDLLRLRVAKALVIGVTAAVIAAVAALAISPAFPLGLARIVEPDAGFVVDGAVLLAGTLAVVVVATALGAVTGWWELRRARHRGTGRPSRVVQAVAGAGAPPAAVAGASLALQTGTRTATVPVRATVTAMVLGAATVIAVLCFMASLGHLTETPPLYGWAWDVKLGQEFSSELTPELEAALLEDPAVTALATGTNATLEIEGHRADALAVDDRVGRLEPSLISGRAAEDVGEVVVVPDLGDVGEEVSVRFAGEETELRIVGHAALPGYDAMTTFETLQRLAPDAARQVAIIDLAEDADVDEFVTRIKAPPLSMIDQDIALPDLPDDLVNFGRVDSAPAVVAGSMALVAVATLVHALVTTVRRRRRDLAVLRTLGFTGRQVLSSVSWQATALVVIALAIAVPIGIAVGRWAWLLFADELHVVGEPVVPILALAAAGMGSLVLANAVALAAGRWSARRSAAVVLRAE